MVWGLAWRRSSVKAARVVGSRAPARRARSMARPVTPLRSRMTLARWTCMSVRAVCLGGMPVAAALMRVSRGRREARHPPRSSVGRKALVSRPQVWSVCRHGPSARAVWRPGRVLAWRALTTWTATPRASRSWKRGIPYTPVRAMTTVSLWQAWRPSAQAWRSAVELANRRTGAGARSGGTATEGSARPTSIPAAWRFNGGSPAVGSGGRWGFAGLVRGLGLVVRSVCVA